MPWACSRVRAACSMSGRAVHGDHARDVRRQRLAHLSRSAPEVANHQSLVEQRQQRRQVNALAEQLHAQAVPLARGRREERLGLRRGAAAARSAAGVRPVRCRCPSATCSRITGQSCRAPLSRLVERHAVEPAGAIAPRHHPPVVRQRLQVAAHGGLRQLQHGAQLRHGQLVPFERQQHPDPDGVGQRRHVVENWGGHIHPYIRMKEIIRPFQPFFNREHLCALSVYTQSTYGPIPRRVISPTHASGLRGPAGAGRCKPARLQHPAGGRGPLRGAVTLHAGTLYRALARLLEQALDRRADCPAGPGHDDERRRYYGITPRGVAVARAEIARLESQLVAARSRRLLQEGAA